MKIKGKSKDVLIKAFYRLKDSNPVKAGHIKNYLRAHFWRSTRNL